MICRLTAILALIACGALFIGFGGSAAQARPSPSSGNSPTNRIAIIAGDSRLSAALDLLTVDLSHEPGVALLEREQIAKILREQALSLASSADVVKAGRLAGAGGLVVFKNQAPTGIHGLVLASEHEGAARFEKRKLTMGPMRCAHKNRFIPPPMPLCSIDLKVHYAFGVACTPNSGNHGPGSLPKFCPAFLLSCANHLLFPKPLALADFQPSAPFGHVWEREYKS